MEGLSLHVEANDKGPEDLQLCLVGRFVTTQSIRKHIMKERLAEIWRPLKGVSIREIVPGIILFQFVHVMDLERVCKGGPWTQPFAGVRAYDDWSRHREHSTAPCGVLGPSSPSTGGFHDGGSGQTLGKLHWLLCGL